MDRWCAPHAHLPAVGVVRECDDLARGREGRLGLGDEPAQTAVVARDGGVVGVAAAKRVACARTTALLSTRRVAHVRTPLRAVANKEKELSKMKRVQGSWTGSKGDVVRATKGRDGLQKAGEFWFRVSEAVRAGKSHALTWILPIIVNTIKLKPVGEL
eukprot:220746-Pleurochrysis_carterae.AAC.1